MAKKKAARETKRSLLKEIDAAIALLNRVRALAESSPDDANTRISKKVSLKTKAKRILSADAREAIAAAQRRRWARVRRAKKKAERAALAR